MLWSTVITVAVVMLAGFTGYFVTKVIKAKNKQLMEFNENLEQTNASLARVSRAAKRANQIKSEFIANMSHELRTPITSIKASLGILTSGMINNIPDDAMGLVQIADENVDSLNTLINDVLDFSKIEAGEIEISNETFALKETFSRFVLPYQLKSKNKGVDFILNFQQNLPEIFYGDLENISKIMSQFLNNAIKFTHQGSIVVNVEVENNSYLSVIICDSGIGIDEGELDKPFEN